MRSLPALSGFLSFVPRRFGVTFEVRRVEEVSFEASFLINQRSTAIRTVFTALMTRKTGLMTGAVCLVFDEKACR